MFDDPYWARVLTPAITAVAQPTLEIGRTAFELLRARLKSEQRLPQQVVLDTRLVLRDSCAPPRSGKRI
jgi:DNA-binding LacI/PurR family transcriptional regulator